MDINMIFFLNAIFISMVNLFGGREGLLCSLLFILAVYFKRKDRILTLVLSGITIFLYVNYSLKTMDKLGVNKTYEFQMDVVSDNAKIIKTDGKHLKISYYPVLDKFLEDGSYNVLGRINKIEDARIELVVLKDEKIETPIKDLLNNRVEKLVSAFPYEFQNFVAAVLLGRKDGISQEVREKFNYTGTSHILVISGLHIGIIIFSILVLLKKLPYQIRYAMAGIILTAYCYGVGFTPSVLRAYIMGVLYLGAKIFYEEREMKKALMLAFMVSGFINPYAIRSISYQMSYLALAGILFLYPKIQGEIKRFIPKKLKKIKLIDFLILSFSIQLILIPIFLYYFRVLPLFSFIPNLIVIPLGTVTVQVLFIALLLSFIGLGKILMPLGYYLYKLLSLIIDIFSKIPFLTLAFYVKISLLLYIFLYVLILLFILFEREKIRKYWYIVLGIIPLIFLVPPQRIEKLDLKWMNYRSTPNEVLFLNRRPERREILLLKDSGINRLDYIVTSYGMENNELKEAYPGAETTVLEKGQRIKVGDEFFINEKGRIKKVTERK
ncbi:MULTISPECIES: ComEC/Rec2 family competence protein [Psychrilyobacter]|uniref:ComEC/Rec2 family competence protein n=1 Tax=Psychrilyobacter piezotolerans TaxID=2293438 RepID=A0ABX9KL59_9FUSO|nr:MULTISPECIES: ComEC/Rec2 family competence protein [Psychrilyobacter]MCS5423023.1 ComEC/Rec2 family competence protein [Psychrilyobacter sp. S5]NDI76514.1 ComEC/Rec2 family competence protein [Psychrilyobacter piezotolerans]RDE66105.1 ComEC/Rec2 family competence protein [Psychrilyobacter sp. S5]REI43283.1 ComEC/Rec2 family competence protein [Psychrilyobacter piezotolerans]